MDNMEKLLQDGELTLKGFMGEDKRGYEQIIAKDAEAVKLAGLSNEKIAARLEELTEKGRDLMEREKLVEGRYHMKVRDDRGPMPGPFGDKVFRKGDVILQDDKTGICLRWNELTISMAREHGFFSGHGSDYRLEPIDVAKALF